jgi:hypothetical protein
MKHGESPNVPSLVACVSDIRKWMVAQVLLFNSEMLVLSLKKQRDILLDLTINVDGGKVVSNKTVKRLGVNLDPDLSIDEHIKTVSRTAFFHNITLQKSETFYPKMMQKNVFATSKIRLLQWSTIRLPG